MNGRPKPERERERERESETPTRNQTTRTNNKKQVRGGSLGEDAVAEVRVDDVERGQEENTRGTTNRNAVCVSPAPEEEKKRDATTANKKKQPNNRQKKRGTQK